MGQDKKYKSFCLSVLLAGAFCFLKKAAQQSKADLPPFSFYFFKFIGSLELSLT
jgi:hypothetical protein